MWPDRVSNLGLLAHLSDALLTALRSRAFHLELTTTGKGDIKKEWQSCFHQDCNHSPFFSIYIFNNQGPVVQSMVSLTNSLA